MNGLELYNKVRVVPQDAIKPIAAGRLKGKSDINPMWRIKELTEHFGPCGIGWKYTIDKQWVEQGSGDEVAAFVNISLYYKVGDVWSEAIPGTGGNSFVTRESKGPYTSDECYKMALTDALSVACKALGFGADVYWASDRTKYQEPQGGHGEYAPKQEKISADQKLDLESLLQQCKSYTLADFIKQANIQKLEDLQAARYEGAKKAILAKIAAEQK